MCTIDFRFVILIILAMLVSWLGFVPVYKLLGYPVGKSLVVSIGALLAGVAIGWLAGSIKNSQEQ